MYIGDCKPYLEEEIARRNKIRQDRIEAEREKQMQLDLLNKQEIMGTLAKLCVDLRAPKSRAEQGEDGAEDNMCAQDSLIMTLDEEQEKMVNLVAKTSLLVVGRSGTGKTTVAIQRMVLGQQLHGESFNQVFVTMNSVLLGFVRKNYHTFCPGRGVGTIPQNLLSITSKDFPLFLDTRQWLSLLMRSVVDFLAPKSAQLCGAFLAAVGPADLNVIEAAHLPTPHISQASVQAEVDISIFTFQMWPRMVGKHKSSANSSAAKFGGKGQTVERNLSAAAAFAEIMSTIKGSTGALRANGCLSRQDYLTLPAKAGVGGSAGIRSEIYDLFLKYEEIKKEMGFYDLCDVICATHSGLVAWKAAGGGQEMPIHSILVDEVQDCSQSLIKTFLSACSDPNGLFLAGDTCQTIAKGVGGFRFEDLRSMFFEERQLQLSDTGDGRMYEGDLRLVNVPPLLQLATNYRSHNGILKCANVLVSLLVELFPTSVDRMRLEDSKKSGEKPVLLPDVTPLELYTLIHGLTESYKFQAEFGAEQVIIVRTTESKSKVKIEFPTALVMTVEECKGLEFQDCIIYNFFSDSTADARGLWMGVLNWVKHLNQKLDSSVDDLNLAVGEMRGVLGSLANKDGDERLLACALANKFKCGRDMNDVPPFEPSQHYVICEELKALYVSVTRAKARIVFFDEDEQMRAPIFELLERAGVANKMSLLARSQLSSTGGGASSLAQASTPKEWRAQGVLLFRAQRFDGAAQCFEKSGDDLEHSEAAACRNIAEVLLNESSPANSASKLAAAAEGLLSSYSQHGLAVHAEVAARCLVSAGVLGEQVSGAVFLGHAACVLRALDRVQDAGRCEHVAVRMSACGEGSDALVNSLGIRYAQLMHYSWAVKTIAQH